MEINEEDFSLWILYVFAQSKKDEWNRYRDEAVDLSDAVTEKLYEYFDNIFKNKALEYLLIRNTPLYRARQIKSDEWSKVGTNIQQIKDDYLKIFLLDEQIKVASEPNSFASPEMMAVLKFICQKELDEDQLTRSQELIKKYSASNFFYGFLESDSSVPPSKNRQEGRLNSKDDSFLYTSLEKDTAIYEMRPSIGQSYSIAKCVSHKTLHLADLRIKQELTDNDDFLAFSIYEKVSEPNSDNNVGFYHITQCLSHYFQNKKFDGIAYSSSLRKGGTNIMLFEEKNIKFISSEIISINDVNVDYTTQLPFGI